MCISTPKIPTTPVEQLNKNNVMLSNEKTAGTTGEKESKKRNIGSLRVPVKKASENSTGITNIDSITGLNIPV